ncbi:hypothetical protein HBH51_239150 [Parastagonospora nodorum]|nr:hypothetical protein HBH51_239150 [Parastagonospora nodorum]
MEYIGACKTVSELTIMCPERRGSILELCDFSATQLIDETFPLQRCTLQSTYMPFNQSALTPCLLQLQQSISMTLYIITGIQVTSKQIQTEDNKDICSLCYMTRALYEIARDPSQRHYQKLGEPVTVVRERTSTIIKREQQSSSNKTNVVVNHAKRHSVLNKSKGRFSFLLEMLRHFCNLTRSSEHCK